MHIDRIPVYRVYQRAIDLELYHSFAELVVQTSQDDTARRTYRQTRAMQIWQVETDVSGYFEPYHLRYPGEVLERFEEKLKGLGAVIEKVSSERDIQKFILKVS